MDRGDIDAPHFGGFELSRLLESAPKEVGDEKAEHIYGDEVRNPLGGLSLEKKIAVVLFGSPKRYSKITQEINSNSPLGERVDSEEVKSKLGDMRRDNKVYHLKVDKKKNNSWVNMKWHLSSDYIVDETVKQTLEVMRD